MQSRIINIINRLTGNGQKARPFAAFPCLHFSGRKKLQHIHRGVFKWYYGGTTYRVGRLKTIFVVFYIFQPVIVGPEYSISECITIKAPPPLVYT